MVSKHNHKTVVIVPLIGSSLSVVGQFGFRVQGAALNHEGVCVFEKTCHEGLEENGIYF